MFMFEDKDINLSKTQVKSARKKPKGKSPQQIKELLSVLLNPSLKRSYLDIETDFNGEPTLVGIYNFFDGSVYQIQKPYIKADKIHSILENTEVVVTYNGENFDLDVLKKKVGFVLPKNIISLDLMFLCWELDLYGGLKKVEKKLNIYRDPEVEDFNGRDAIELWKRYEMGDKFSLELLKLYNRYDVVNLAKLESKLRKMFIERENFSHPKLPSDNSSF